MAVFTGPIRIQISLIAPFFSCPGADPAIPLLLRPKTISALAVNNATVPSVSSFPVEPTPVGLTGQTVSNFGGLSSISYTKSYTTSSTLTNLYSTANTNTMAKTFGYSVGFELGFQYGVKDVASVNGKVTSGTTGSYAWTNTGTTTNSFTNQTTSSMTNSFTVTVAPNQIAYIYETVGQGTIDTNYTVSVTASVTDCHYHIPPSLHISLISSSSRSYNIRRTFPRVLSRPPFLHAPTGTTKGTATPPRR